MKRNTLKLKYSMAVKRNNACGSIINFGFASQAMMESIVTKIIGVNRHRSRKIYAHFLCA